MMRGTMFGRKPKPRPQKVVLTEEHRAVCEAMKAALCGAFDMPPERVAVTMRAKADGGLSMRIYRDGRPAPKEWWHYAARVAVAGRKAPVLESKEG